MDSKTFIIDLIDKQIDDVLQTFQYDCDFVKILKSHNHEIIVKFPVKLDNGGWSADYTISATGTRESFKSQYTK